MVIRLHRAFMLGTVIEKFTDLALDVPEIVTLSANEFIMKYKDVEPKLILQYLIINDTVETLVSLINTTNNELLLSCSMGFKTILMGQINSLTDRVISSYDIRFTNKSTLSIEGEKMLVLGVSHDYSSNLTYLKVERTGTKDSHYTGANIRVVRTSPSIEVFNALQGMVMIDWTEEDTSSPGLYELEVTVSRGSAIKWSVLPIQVRVDEDYNLS